jgi:hypothetical protein
MSEKAHYTPDNVVRFYDEGFMTPDEQEERRRGLEETEQYLKTRPSQDASGLIRHPETRYPLSHPEKYFDAKRDQAYNNSLAEIAYDSDKVSISELIDTLNFFEERIKTMPIQGKVGQEAYGMAKETSTEVSEALQNKLNDLSLVPLTKLLVQAEVEKNETLAENVADVIEDKVEAFRSAKDPEHDKVRIANLNARLDAIYEKEVDMLWAARKPQKAQTATPEPQSQPAAQPLVTPAVQAKNEVRMVTADELDQAPESSSDKMKSAEANSQSEPELVMYELDEESGRRRLVERYSAEKHQDLTIDPSLFITAGKRRRTLLHTADDQWLYIRGDRLLDLTKGVLLAREEAAGDFPSFKVNHAWKVIPGQLETKAVEEVLNQKHFVKADSAQLYEVSDGGKDPFVDAERQAIDILVSRGQHDELQVRTDVLAAPSLIDSLEKLRASEAHQQARRQRNARNIWNSIKGKVTNFSPREFYGDKEKGTKRAKATLLGAVVTLFATGGVFAHDLLPPHQAAPTPQARPHQPEHSTGGGSGLNIAMARSSKKPRHNKKSPKTTNHTGMGHMPETIGGTTTHTKTSHDGLNVTMIRDSQPVPAPKSSK